MSEPLRIGILGAARIAERALVGPARTLGDQVVAVAARDAERAADYASLHGIAKSYGSYDDLLSDPEVEVVYNPSPNSEHVRWTLAALRAGKHVLSEKPFGSNADEARLVADEPNPDGLVIFEGFHHHYHPAYQRVLELVAQSAVGEVERLDVTMAFPCPLDDIRYDWSLAGGSLMDLGCYTLHVARDVAAAMGGEFVLNGCRATVHPDADPRVDATAVAEGVLPNGAPVRLVASLKGPNDRSIVVTGTRGSIRQPNFIEVDTDDRVIWTTGGDERVEHHGTTSTYTHQLAALRAAVRDGAAFPTDLANALANMAMIDRCYRLAGLPLREGRV
ncbi:MAG: Gfo/Idh/MocA family oxidoreductase [Micropruina sp.]|nr:MAG: Gfo/Idh/MocA family oxidoreductase [Micropruina sp.]